MEEENKKQEPVWKPNIERLLQLAEQIRILEEQGKEGLMSTEYERVEARS